MKTQMTITDRRQHTREGVLSEIEDITYRVLRKYGISPAEQNCPSKVAENVA